MYLKKLMAILLAVPLLIQAQENNTILHFNNLDSLLHFTEKNTYTAKTSNEETLLAKWTKITALANTINLKSNATLSAIDNTKLSVSFLPAEIFGGPSGTFKAVSLGQQYVSSLALNPQIDIVNLEYWGKVKSANLNEKITELNNINTKKAIFESVAACYINIISLQEQIKTIRENLNAADTLVFITNRKYEQGIVKIQDVNEARINQITVADKLTQATHNLEQQYLSLKILCDIDTNTELEISGNLFPKEDFSYHLTANSLLFYKINEQQNSFAKTEFKNNIYAHLPVLSLVSSFSWQNNSNQHFFDENARWINANYIGLKLSVPFPIDINKFSQTSLARYKSKIAHITLQHAALQNHYNNQQLENDYRKAFTQVNNLSQIYQLKNDNYHKNYSLYEAEIIPLDKLLTSFNDMLNAKMNYIAMQTNYLFYKHKININNTIQ